MSNDTYVDVNFITYYTQLKTYACREIIKTINDKEQMKGLLTFKGKVRINALANYFKCDPNTILLSYQEYKRERGTNENNY